jgi:hypothetical protein
MNDGAWRQLLVQEYPHLFMRSFRGTPFAPGYPSCPDGWREIVVRVVKRVSEAAAGYPIHFCQVSAQYGRLSIYWKAEAALPYRVERAIEYSVALAEARAACSCAICGSAGRLFSDGGWLTTACPEHACGERVRMRPDLEGVYIVRGSDGAACRRYDRKLDAFVEADPSLLIMR